MSIFAAGQGCWQVDPESSLSCSSVLTSNKEELRGHTA